MSTMVTNVAIGALRRRVAVDALFAIMSTALKDTVSRVGGVHVFSIVSVVMGCVN
jgi:hypothetical protein